MSEPCLQRETIRNIIDDLKIITEIVSQKSEVIGKLTEATNSLKDAVVRLDIRINGTFETIGKHISESPEYRSKITVLEMEVKNIKEEKLNTVKNSQWRIALIVGAVSSLLTIISRYLWK